MELYTPLLRIGQYTWDRHAGDTEVLLLQHQVHRRLHPRGVLSEIEGKYIKIKRKNGENEEK